LAQETRSQLFNKFYQESKVAYQNLDYPLMVKILTKADSLVENHPTILYNLAVAHSLSKDSLSACKTLQRLILQNNTFQFEQDSDFFDLMQTNCFKEVLNSQNTLNQAISNSKKLEFPLPYPDFHPEGVAYDPKSKNFWTGSIRRRMVGVWDKKLGYYNYVDETQGLYSVLGVKFSTNGDYLWVSSSALPEMRGFRKDLEGRSSVISYNRNTLQFNRYEVPDKHTFGDLIVHPKTGEVFISDSQTPTIFRIIPTENRIEEWFNSPENFFSMQGLDFDKKGEYIYVSDYVSGIFRVRISDKTIEKITWQNPEKATSILKGIDGLYFYENSLIAIHNGTKPFKVCRYFLDSTGLKIKKMEYIDKNRVEMNEPTTGVIVGKYFYYLANSPWGAYDKQGNFSSTTSGNAIILKSKLK
jgi:DNA-binding beta-propeller fold protein YncE